MKYEIMLKILFELLAKKCVKASYLAEKYEVSVRSIHRYISSLELAGVPIYTVRGNNGGFALFLVLFILLVIIGAWWAV